MTGGDSPPVIRLITRESPVIRLITRESTLIDNEDSEPKAQVRLLKFPEENSIFSKTHIIKSILSLHRRSQGGPKEPCPPLKNV